MILQIKNKLKGKLKGTLFKVLKFKNKGFSLLEVLLAVSILSLGLAGVLRAYASSLGTLEIGQYNIDAGQVLRMKMDDLEQEILENGKLMGASLGMLNGFRWQWSIRQVMSEDPEDTQAVLNEVTLKVAYPDNPRELFLTTYYEDKKNEDEEQ